MLTNCGRAAKAGKLKGVDRHQKPLTKIEVALAPGTRGSSERRGRSLAWKRRYLGHISELEKASGPSG
ncbi:hypothetical protein WS99_02720 [Burkholderia territorii]|nr:hypothetical protein WS99_02720 [Burkholderia territorii]KWA50355.1 hypothetical protein WT41_03440 [Burkholderia territorii]